MRGSIRIGVGGWTYAPWRGSFYTDTVTHKAELAFASRALTTIEVNGTYYRTQTPDTFEHWHDETPDDFVFALKAPRFVTNRKVLAEAGPPIERFLASGVTRLRNKMGPINWQFMPTKTFDPGDFERFLRLLPVSQDGLALRHVVEVRHASFAVAEFTDMLRAYGVTAVLAADGVYPQIMDPDASLVYARIMGTVEAEPVGYAGADLDLWAERAKIWAAGGQVRGFGSGGSKRKPRDVFLYVIDGFKARNPLAAMALIDRLA